MLQAIAGPDPEDPTRYGQWNMEKILDYELRARDGRTLGCMGYCNLLAHRHAVNGAGSVWVSYKSDVMRAPIFTKVRDFGFDLADPSDDLKMRYRIEGEATGPIVTNVVEDTAASGAKFKPGDIILKVQMEDVHSVAEFEKKLLERTNKGQRNALIFAKSANGSTRWLTLPLRL